MDPTKSWEFLAGMWFESSFGANFDVPMLARSEVRHVFFLGLHLWSALIPRKLFGVWGSWTTHFSWETWNQNHFFFWKFNPLDLTTLSPWGDVTLSQIDPLVTGSVWLYLTPVDCIHTWKAFDVRSYRYFQSPSYDLLNTLQLRS